MPGQRERDPPILCLGEAIVDLVRERADSSPAAAPLHPHCGGALANVAVAAARAGAPVALAGGVGDDEWGSWLHDRLRSGGVDLRWFELVPGLQTPVAFVSFDPDGEPRFSVYGEGIVAGMRAIGHRIDEAVSAAGALVFGSNTLVGEPERELTLRAGRAAAERGIPVVFDPNLRPNRWDRADRALELCREAAAGVFMVRANLAEARAITGLGDDAGPEQAADALAAHAAVAVVTAGAAGAVVRGEAEASASAPRVEVVSPLGAGDAFLGTLVAGIAHGGWTAAAVAGSLEAACAAGARACTRLGALE